MPDVGPPLKSPPRPRPAAEHFAVDVRYGDRAAAWISPRGELDLASAPQLEHAVQAALSCALLIVIDLSELTFCDCTGLRLLVETDARARRSRRRLVIVRGPVQIDRLFALVGLDERLEIIDLQPVLAPAPEAPAHWPSVA